MKVKLLEMDIAWADPQTNILTAEQLMSEDTDYDLYVLPEMWATGFMTDPEDELPTEEESTALAWMKTTACARGCALCGSLAVRVGENCYNRHYFVTPEEVFYYDKHHLFRYGHEDKWYTCGQEAVIACWKGFRLLLQTCYDLRFPVFSRYGRAGAYDAIVYVANWPALRMLAWDVLIRARAIENQCYVLAVNRTGSDPLTQYVGGSAIIDPVGRVLGTSSAELSIETLQHMRSRFPVLEDRDQARR